MFYLLPPKKDSRWFLVGASLGLFSFILYFLGYTLVMGGDPANMSITVVMLFFVVLAEIYALLGFLGLDWLFIIATGGIFAGLIGMLAVFAGDRSPWEVLMGFLMMLQLFAAGLIMGLAFELILLIRRQLKKSA